MKKAIFLDRDGVLNKAIVKNNKPFSPKTLAEVSIPEGVQKALDALKSAGFLLIGATNQPDVARGLIQKTIVEAIHLHLMTRLKLDEIRVCFHSDEDGCLCRKPLPGLLKAAAAEHGINLSQSYMIGDRWKDIEAGRNAGCRTIWLESHYDEKTPARMDWTAGSLDQASQWILSQQH